MSLLLREDAADVRVAGCLDEANQCVPLERNGGEVLVWRGRFPQRHALEFRLDDRSALEGILVRGGEGTLARKGLELTLGVGVMLAAARRMGWLKRRG